MEPSERKKSLRSYKAILNWVPLEVRIEKEIAAPRPALRLANVARNQRRQSPADTIQPGKNSVGTTTAATTAVTAVIAVTNKILLEKTGEIERRILNSNKQNEDLFASNREAREQITNLKKEIECTDKAIAAATKMLEQSSKNLM